MSSRRYASFEGMNFLIFFVCLTSFLTEILFVSFLTVHTIDAYLFQFFFLSLSCPTFLFITFFLNFKRTYAFGVPSICSLSRSMMVLAWSTKEDIRKELVDTFRELYISKPGTDGKERLPGEDVAKRLVVAVNELDGEDELVSFEELMKIVVMSGAGTIFFFFILFCHFETIFYYFSSSY